MITSRLTQATQSNPRNLSNSTNPTNRSNPMNLCNSINPSNPTILLTFDVEDWFQVENFKQCIPFSAWPNCELRIEKNVHKILDLLDSIKLNNPTNSSHEMQSLFHRDSINVSRESASRKWLMPTNSNNSMNPINPTAAQQHNSTDKNSSSSFTSPLTPYGKNSPCAMPPALCKSPKATFFVLGWIAERLPRLVREIQARRHEVASHGFYHELCRQQSGVDLKNDLERSKKLLEDITGNPVYGYRAPSFSIDNDILKIIEDAGYFYDSSFNSFKLNKRYGQLAVGANNGSNGISFQISDRFYELPISNVRIGKQVFPWGGGGYFRLIPLSIFRQGVKKILKKHGAYLFYLHPWEFDPDQPKVTDAKILYKFRHYTNLDKTLSKFSLLIKNFHQCHFQTSYQYLTFNLEHLLTNETH